MPLNEKDFGAAMKARFGVRIQKLSLDGGFSCPNRTGQRGRGGCTYCRNDAFVPAYCRQTPSISEQVAAGKQFFAAKYKRMKYLAYFQAYTATFAPLEVLRLRYEEALREEDVVGLVISTRPDCLPEEVLSYLADLQQRCFVMLEIGIESTDDRTLSLINRGHSFAETVDALERVEKHGIPCGGHVILGLPGDTREGLMLQARRLSQLPLAMLKVHQLQILRGTEMARRYAADKAAFPLLFDRAEEYVDLLCDYVSCLRPDLPVERFASQSPREMVVAPAWGLKQQELNRMFDERMTQRRKSE